VIEKKVGLAVARNAARSKGVHLVQVLDDKNETLIAASKHPFKVIC
jgi:hypothetical protein